MISDVDSRLYRIPLTHTMTDATHGAMTHFEVVMVLLRDDEGHEGIGYTYTIGLGGAAVVSLIRQALAPLLLQAEPDRINQIWEQMWWRLHYIGRGGLASFAMSAADIALWDLAARRTGQPLWRRLGGNGGPITPYAGGIDLHLDLDGLLDYVQGHLDKGFRAVKIKVGQPRWQDDIERIRAVRELLGPDLTLMVDANMRWDVATAVQAARQMQPFNVYWLEEPTIPDDVAGHARISAEGGVPVATGENLHTIYEFAAMIERGGIAYPEPDVSNIGGITNWLRVAALAYAHNRPVTTHGVHELHLQLLGAIPNPSFLEVHSFGLERFILNPPALIDGVMQLPEELGHGVQFDWEELAGCEVRLP